MTNVMITAYTRIHDLVRYRMRRTSELRIRSPQGSRKTGYATEWFKVKFPLENSCWMVSKEGKENQLVCLGNVFFSFFPTQFLLERTFIPGRAGQGQASVTTSMFIDRCASVKLLLFDKGGEVISLLHSRFFFRHATVTTLKTAV